jgi:hypothetical protein
VNPALLTARPLRLRIDGRLRAVVLDDFEPVHFIRRAYSARHRINAEMAAVRRGLAGV